MEINEKELKKSLEEYEKRMTECQPKFKRRLQHYINMAKELLNGKRESN